MPQTLNDIGEFGLIHCIDDLIKSEGLRVPGVTVGLGDDCAAIQPHQGKNLLVTCDSVVEGRHYLPQHINPRDLGRRCMVLNISDIGAMGGTPLYALISLGLRSGMLVEEVKDLYRGFIQELNPFEACIVGGNITKSEPHSFIDIMLMGEVEHGLMVRRNTAREGDAILVTGYPGQAAAGLQLILKGLLSEDGIAANALVKAYTRPQHRAREGQAIARTGLASAMIDTSDGFLGDLGHICEESNLGATLFLETLPLGPDLPLGAKRLEKDPYDLFLGESDDYELILTCAPEDVEELKSVVFSIGHLPITEVGRMTHPSEDVKLFFPDGSSKPVRPSGWDHFTA